MERTNDALLLLGRLLLATLFLPSGIGKLLEFQTFAARPAATSTSHRYWEFTEPARRAQEINFFKNIGILAGLCFYMVSGPGAWSVSGRRSGASRMQAAE
jgi:uncharacterized membrane protein YphA (DoxX/SURF4 family)